MSFFWCLEHYLCLIKYYSFFFSFLHFNRVNWVIVDTLDLFWTMYLLNSSRVMPAWINSVHAVVRAEWFVILPGKWARFVISRRIDQSVFSPKGFFCTKWKKIGDRCDWWQLKGTIKGHGGRRPMIPKSLICCSGAVQRIIWSWVLFRSGYPEISKFACSGFCLAFSKFQLPLPCSSSSKSWILDHLML